MRLLAIFSVLAFSVSGCNPMSGTSGSAPKANNSAINSRDQNSELKTPIDQNENQADIDITANIRKRVVDTEMSVNAQNVKIVTQDGLVTLRGPVKSAAEKQQIEDIAHAVAGADKVVSQLEIEESR